MQGKHSVGLFNVNTLKYIIMKITRISIFMCFALLLLAGSARGGETCGCDVPPSAVARYDQALLAIPTGQGIIRHAPWGLPVAMAAHADDVQVLVQPNWITGFDSRLHMPVWVIYRLSADDLASRRHRTQCFRSDPRLSTVVGGSDCASFRHSGMDRGHMVPSADMTRSEQAMVNTYVFSNIAPQYAGFNRSIWRELETRVRTMARKKGGLYVISGAIFDYDADGKPDATASAPLTHSRDGRVHPAIASHFYKVVVETAGPRPRISAWLLRHDDRLVAHKDAARILDAAKVPLRTIEAMSGLDLMPLLDQALTETAER